MQHLTRTDSNNPAFIILASELEEELRIRDGINHETLASLNKIDFLPHTLVLLDQENPIGCGALRQYEPGTTEIKRMYVRLHHREKGFATTILLALEQWATELGFSKCILETGQNQPEAIAFYLKNGYAQTANFGPYINSGNSVCFEKLLTATPG